MTKKKIKEIVNHVPKYKVDDIVYAISLNNDSNTEHGMEQNTWDRDYARIYKASVESISIDKNGVTYWLKDLKDKTEWGDSVDESHISSNYDELTDWLFKLWKL
jgi:hypothetical protein